MSATLGGLPLLDPRLLRQSCLDHGLPLEPWFGRANSYRCPLGIGPGTGHVLMRRGEFDKLDPARSYDLVLGDSENTVTVKALRVTSAVCVSPGWEADPSACYLVSLADRRDHDRTLAGFWYAAGGAWNFRYDDGTPVTDFSRSGSTSYTWAQVLTNVWDLSYGFAVAFPGLPFAPDGTPDHFDYSAWEHFDAVEHALTRLACRVRYDPLGGTFSVVRVGAADPAADRAVAKLRPHLVWSDHPRAGEPADPRYVVLHLRTAPDVAGGLPWMVRSAASASAADLTVHLWDDLIGLPKYDTTASFVNQTAADARVAERLADYRRAAALRPEVRVYAGFRPEAVAALGPLWSEVAFRDDDLGPRTELARTDFTPALRAWRPAGRPVVRRLSANVVGGAGAPAAGGGWTRTTGVMTLPHEMYKVRVDLRAWFKGVLTAGGGAGATLDWQLATTDSAGTAPTLTLYTHSGAAAAGAALTFRDACELDPRSTVAADWDTRAPVYVAVFARLTGAGSTCALAGANANEVGIWGGWEYRGS